MMILELINVLCHSHGLIMHKLMCQCNVYFVLSLFLSPSFLSLCPLFFLQDQPLIITINRRLLRHSRYSIPTPVEERSHLPTASAIKMRLARFGAGQASPTGSTGHVTSTPTVNPRKRERAPDPDATLLAGRDAKRLNEAGVTSNTGTVTVQVQCTCIQCTCTNTFRHVEGHCSSCACTCTYNGLD